MALKPNKTLAEGLSLQNLLNLWLDLWFGLLHHNILLNLAAAQLLPRLFRSGNINTNWYCNQQQMSARKKQLTHLLWFIQDRACAVSSTPDTTRTDHISQQLTSGSLWNEGRQNQECPIVWSTLSTHCCMCLSLLISNAQTVCFPPEWRQSRHRKHSMKVEWPRFLQYFPVGCTIGEHVRNETAVCIFWATDKPCNMTVNLKSFNRCLLWSYSNIQRRPLSIWSLTKLKSKV